MIKKQYLPFPLEFLVGICIFKSTIFTLVGVIFTLYTNAIAFPINRLLKDKNTKNVETQFVFDDDVKNFVDYKLVRISPKLKEELEYLQNLYDSDEVLYDIDFWQAPTHIGAVVDLTIAPNYAEEFFDELHKKDIDYYVVSNNLQSLINKEKTSSFKHDSDISHVSQSHEEPDYHYDRYNPLSTIVTYLFRLREQNPELISIYDIGKTHENRSIYTVKISSPPNPEYIFEHTPPAIWLDGGIHAREWIATATGMNIIRQLVEGYLSKDPETTRLVESLTFYITVVLNPDGYEYSHTKNRLWRKNRSSPVCKLLSNGNEICCRGVDLNRNFDWHFGTTGKTKDPCHHTYSGSHAFSEPESRAVQNFLTKIPVKAFITLHSYSQLWLIPFSHKRNSYPVDYFNILKPLSIRATKALTKLYGTKYSVGTGSELLYDASGVSHDYAKGKLNIPYSFLIELRPKQGSKSGFLLSESQIMPTGDETFLAIKVVAEEVINTYGENRITTPIVSTIGTSTLPEIYKPDKSTENSSFSVVKTTFSKKPQNMITYKPLVNGIETFSKISPTTIPPYVKNNTTSSSSEIEFIVMIELRQGKKKKVIGIPREVSKENPDVRAGWPGIDLESIEIEPLTGITPIDMSLTKNAIETSSTTFSPKSLAVFTTKMTTQSPLPLNTVHCHDFNYYCKWWKIHSLCNKPEVAEKCAFSCRVECQI